MSILPNRVLVTGSSGFIGHHLVKKLVADNVVVLGVDIQAPQSDVEDYEFIQCDICHADRLMTIVQEFAPTAVIHLAARTDLDEEDNIQGYAANIDGVQNLVEAIKATSSIQLCIFTSSQLVCRLGYVPRHDEDYCPNTLYGESKVLTETIVRNQDGGGVTWCIVRPTTVWGAGMNQHYRRFFRLIRKGRYFHIGKRPLQKTYGYVGNVVHQYQSFLGAEKDQINRQTFYVGDYEPIILQRWIDAFQAELGARPIPTVPIWAAKIGAQCGDVLNRIGIESFPFNSFRLNNILTEYQFDLTATRQICGELPYNQAQGIRETVHWLVNDVFPEG
ncbi:MAG TPA: NAD(P)-dependent oxidoreductase [Chloroflexi bacterium]|nr:NAD(P)-dependent oxidoreductase [Chloroflexota bacterium]HHW87794.1 NAD-dependent epimerase/dehydratase family protein [Chloroflexota bacterium]